MPFRGSNISVSLHIGVHKTATTEVQWALDKARTRLEQGGLTYLGPESLRGQRLDLHLYLRTLGGHLADRIAGDLRGLMDGRPDLLLSDENMIGTTARGAVIGPDGALYPRADEGLGRVLAVLPEGPKVQVFMAVRDFASFITSTYSQQLRKPLPLHHEVYLRDFRLDAMSWAALARRVLSHPRVGRLVCWRYEDHAAIRPALLDRMLGPELAVIVPRARRMNTGISQAAYDAFVAAAMADDEAPTQDLLRAACKAHPKGEGVPAMRVLPPQTHRDSLIRYDADLSNLAALDRVEMLTPDPAPPEAAGSA
ncbi:hypothetical protein [Paracoccus jeotgali]|uniref:hypothetical protein n=1 Tax=Paracoccus jeotgali TaxID=2065379 RepID=UPI0028AFEBCA|nr:hypothetical protein [Paracoccus jeotgali]